MLWYSSVSCLKPSIDINAIHSIIFIDGFAKQFYVYVMDAQFLPIAIASPAIIIFHSFEAGRQYRYLVTIAGIIDFTAAVFS